MTTRDIRRYIAVGLLLGPLVVSVAPALGIPFVLYVMCNLPAVVKAVRFAFHQSLTATVLAFQSLTSIVLAFGKKAGKHPKTTGFCILGASFILASVLVYALEKSIVSAQKRAELHFIIQILTGNWSSPPFQYPDQASGNVGVEPLHDPYGLVKISTSAGLAFALNLAAFGLVAVAIRTLNKLRMERAMRPRTIYGVRDIAIKLEIDLKLEALEESGILTSEQVKTINKAVVQAFTDGDKIWYERYINSLSDNPARMRDIIEKGIMEEARPNPS